MTAITLPITILLFLINISSTQSACSNSKFIQKLKSPTTNPSDYNQSFQQRPTILDAIGNNDNNTNTDISKTLQLSASNQSIITTQFTNNNNYSSGGGGGGSSADFQGSPNSNTEVATTTSNQELSLNDLHSFRLEFNKYKILAHLGIRSDPDNIKPAIDDDLRSKLTTSTAMSEPSNGLSSSRRKRSLTCDQVKGNKNACCLENFYVNFTYIGWDKWILYPSGYNANYCRGQCDLSHARYYHSTLLSKYSNVISLCCSPKQMAPLRLLYIDESNKVHEKSIPDMVVESCDCA